MVDVRCHLNSGIFRIFFSITVLSFSYNRASIAFAWDNSGILGEERASEELEVIFSF